MPVVFIVAEIIVIECFQQNKASGVFVAEAPETFVGGFFKISETDDVAVVFYGIQDAVGSGVCLKEAVHPQVFVNPQRVERGCVKACKEHVYHNEQVDFAVLHAK